MHSNEHILAVSDISTHKSNVHLFVDLIFERVQTKLTVLGWLTPCVPCYFGAIPIA